MNAAVLAPSATLPPLAGQGSVWSRFFGLFAHNHVGNVLFVTTVVIGFFHGWLKLRYRSSITTFAFDIPLMMTLGWTLLRLSRMAPWFPAGRMGSALKLFVGLCLVYLALPFGVPMLAGLSAFRAWCFIPLTFLLGYHLVRSVRQVEAYFWLIILLGVATAIYGMRQSPEEIRQKMLEDAEFAAKFYNSFYGNAKGEARLRVFSTFVTAAAFGGTMAYAIMFAVSRFSVAGNSWRERVLLLACAVPMAYGIVLSGSRTSMVMMATGLVFTAWYRRNLLQYIVAPVLAYGAFKFGESYTGGDSLDRFSSLLDWQQFSSRLNIVVSPMTQALLEAPFGGGLGRSGHGVPYSFTALLRGFQFRSVDGDIGRLAVDMGLVGLAVFGWLLIAGMIDAYRNMKELRDTPLTVVGVPAGAMFMIAVVTIPTGSPFLAIPSGALLWFFLGALERLTQEYRKLEAIAPETVRSNEMFISFIKPPKARRLFGDEKPAEAPVTTPRARLVKPVQPAKRYLFRRTETEASVIARRRARLRQRQPPAR